MRAAPPRLERPPRRSAARNAGSGRTCLALLCLLAVSITIRLSAYAHSSETAERAGLEAASPSIDLGAGIRLPRAAAGRYSVPVGLCRRPAVVTFVWAGPYGSDPSLADAVQPDDRIAYLYRGWNLGDRFATIGLNAVHFARRAYARLTTGTNPPADAMAVKVIVPAGCDATPEDVLAAFRTQVGSAD